MPGLQSRRWSWTLYPRDGVDYVVRMGGFVEEGRFSYLCFGFETCPSTGRRHLQGYAELSKKATLGGVKKKFSEDSIHLEPSKGDQRSNIAYCQKDEDFYEFGSKMEDGGFSKKQRFEDAKVVLKNGGSLLEVAEQDFGLFLQHARSLQLYHSLVNGERNFQTIGFWLWGPTGTGKSRTALEHSSKAFHSSCWLPDNSGRWFDGYEGEEACVFDDITPTSKPELSLLLRLIDRYPLRVPVKGGFKQFKARAVYITSNFSPEELYGGHQLPALMRRLDAVVHLD